MITNAVLAIILGLAGFFISFLELFGEAELPAGISNSLPDFAGYYSTMNTIFPVDTVLVIIAAQVVIETSIMVYRLVKWTWEKIPSIN